MLKFFYKYLLIIGLHIFIYSCTSREENHSSNPLKTINPEIYTSSEWINSLKNAQKDDPNNPEILYKLSKYYAAKNELSKALEFGLSALRIDEGDPATLVLVSSIYKRLGQEDDGLKLAEKAYQKGYRSVELNLILAELYIEKSKFSSAQFYLNHILEIDPDFDKSIYFKGLIALAEGDTAKAIVNLEKFISKNATAIGALETLAQIYLKSNKQALALKYAKMGYSVQNSSNLAFLISKGYSGLDLSDSSWKYLQLSIRDSSMAEALGKAGEKYFIRKNYISAIQCFKKEETLSTTFSHSLWLAEAYLLSGNTEEAKYFYKQFLETDSTNEAAKSAFARLSRKKTIISGQERDLKKYLPEETPLMDTLN